VVTPNGVERQRLALPNASLASQALMPPADDVEMSCTGRRFADLGRKLACRAPLETQVVHADDGVLGPFARSTPSEPQPGLATSYDALIRAAFAPRFWSDEARGAYDAPAGDGALPYSQLEANFALFFALSLQLYQATLVSDQSPFDQSRRDENGIPIDLSPSAQNGFTAFRVAHCNTCHLGPLLTAAAIVPNAELVKTNPLAFGNETFTVSTTRNVVARTPVVGDGAPGPVLIDTGFASNGVARPAWDVGLGGLDPFGHPLSFSEQWLQHLAGNAAGVVDPYVDAVRACDLEVPIARDRTQANPNYFTLADGIQPQPQGTEDCFNLLGAWIPTPAAAAAELADPENRHMRHAAVGSFKIPTLRNVELTGPYMHNGSMATLDEVVAFYTRGGNFEEFPLHFGTVFPQPDLAASAQTRADLIAFLVSLTDERVRYERAPFDHPELRVPHGHAGDAGYAEPGHTLGGDLAQDEVLVLPAVGAAGRAMPLATFAETLDACTSGCSADVPLHGAAAPRAEDEVCRVPVPEPTAAPIAALVALLSLRLATERRPPSLSPPAKRIRRRPERG
jgi:cytochrome c peroxidase